jgi:glutamate carboxypeptidase
MPRLRLPCAALMAALAVSRVTTVSAQALSPLEQRIRDAAAAMRDEQIAYLERVINIPSSTLNVAGVRRVGDVFRASFDSLGFTTRWVEMPPEMNRAGHLVAERRGREGAARLLLIGHFDTVVEPAGATFVRTDSVARGIGGGDMKGGDVVLLYALRALHAAGALEGLNITVVITGDEELPGRPLDVARAALIDAGRASDVALGFEGGSRRQGTYARRGSSSWILRTTGRQAHSSGVFGQGAGYGAIYEMARILDAFRRDMAGEPYLTFNAATVVGGADVAYDTAAGTGTAASKTNIVPPAAVVHGDLRFISDEQLQRTRRRMRDIVARSLPGTSAEIAFMDSYPAMAPTAGGRRILGHYSAASQALGYGPIAPIDPGQRGAADIAFVAPFVDGIDGLGALGSRAHAPDETVNLATLVMQTERAAVLIHRLGNRPGAEFRRSR